LWFYYFTTRVELHDQWGLKGCGCWFVEVGRGFLGVLLSSGVLRWRVPGTVLGVAVPGGALLGS
jgi:hypothetical protein